MLDFCGVKKKYEKVFEIIDARWSNKLHRPLHIAGHILNPGWFCEVEEEGHLIDSLWEEYHACVEKTNTDIAIPDLLVVDVLRCKIVD